MNRALEMEIPILKQLGYDIEIYNSTPTIYLVFRNYPLPSNYNKKTTSLLIQIPPSYPNGKLDMFWVDEDVTLSDGKIPQAAENIEHHQGQRWRRFSWHPQSWSPNNDVMIFLEFINYRLNKGC